MTRCKAKNSRGSQCHQKAVDGKPYCILDTHRIQFEGETKKQSNKEKIIRFINYVVGVVVLALFCSWLYDQIRDKSEPLHEGALEISKINPQKDFSLFLGSNKFTFGYNSLAKGIYVDDLFRKSGAGPVSLNVPLLLKTENNKLFISAWLTDQNGSMIVQVTDNKFTKNPNSSFDLNYSPRCFEIVDKAKSPIFQLIQRENNIFIKGFFYKGNRKTIIDDHGMQIMNLKAIPSPITFERLFNYPSAKMMGNLLDSKKYQNCLGF